MLEKKNFDKMLIMVSLVGVLSIFAFIVIFVGEGNVRHVVIFWKEEIKATVAFENIRGNLLVVGLEGNGGTNPTLVMKTGDTRYILTVINYDSKPHVFYVDGLNVKTRLLEPGQNDTVILVSKEEKTYNYYDGLNMSRPIGQVIAAKVEFFD